MINQKANTKKGFFKKILHAYRSELLKTSIPESLVILIAFLSFLQNIAPKTHLLYSGQLASYHAFLSIFSPILLLTSVTLNYITTYVFVFDLVLLVFLFAFIFQNCRGKQISQNKNSKDKFYFYQKNNGQAIKIAFYFYSYLAIIPLVETVSLFFSCTEFNSLQENIELKKLSKPMKYICNSSFLTVSQILGIIHIVIYFATQIFAILFVFPREFHSANFLISQSRAFDFLSLIKKLFLSLSFLTVVNDSIQFKNILLGICLILNGLSLFLIYSTPTFNQLKIHAKFAMFTQIEFFYSLLLLVLNFGFSENQLWGLHESIFGLLLICFYLLSKETHRNFLLRIFSLNFYKDNFWKAYFNCFLIYSKVQEYDPNSKFDEFTKDFLLSKIISRMKMHLLSCSNKKCFCNKIRKSDSINIMKNSDEKILKEILNKKNELDNLALHPLFYKYFVFFTLQDLSKKYPDKLAIQLFLAKIKIFGSEEILAGIQIISNLCNKQVSFCLNNDLFVLKKQAHQILMIKNFNEIENKDFVPIKDLRKLHKIFEKLENCVVDIFQNYIKIAQKLVI